MREKTLAENTELVEQIRSGKKSAEKTLVERYWRPLFYILSKRSQDPELAKDIAQDTFIVVLQHVRTGQLNTPDALGSYIRQTGCNLLISHYRKESRRDTVCDGDVEVKAPDNSPDLYRILYSQQGVELVTQLLSEMSQPRDRAVLMGTYLYDKDKEQLCRELDIGHDNFDKVLHRAKARLKQMLTHRLAQEASDFSRAEVMLLILLTTGLAGRPSAENIKFVGVELEDFTPSAHWVEQGIEHNSFAVQHYRSIEDSGS